MTVTAVDHTRDHDLTIQGNQAARARALTHLLELPGMPTVTSWTIDIFTTTLIGLIERERNGTTEDAQRKVQTWADFLHADVATFTANGTVTYSAEAACEYGVRVRISTHLPAAIKEVAA